MASDSNCRDEKFVANRHGGGATARHATAHAMRVVAASSFVANPAIGHANGSAVDAAEQIA